MMKVINPFRACLYAGVLLLLLTGKANAVTLLDPVEGKKEAQELIGKLLSLQPTEDSTNYGTVKYFPKDKTKRLVTPMRFIVRVTPTNWMNIYEPVTNPVMDRAQFVVTHAGTNLNQYELFFTTSNSVGSLKLGTPQYPLNGNMIIPYLADFSIGDLGLDFLHWPSQRIVKKEFAHNCGCSVLESINPDPANKQGYSKVLTWFDNDSLGVVQAEAYDVKGDLLKEFTPESLSKVNGQWQVEEIRMDNVQTKSHTVITFDLNH